MWQNAIETHAHVETNASYKYHVPEVSEPFLYMKLCCQNIQQITDITEALKSSWYSDPFSALILELNMSKKQQLDKIQFFPTVVEILSAIFCYFAQLLDQ